jgi:hypothetical protein
MIQISRWLPRLPEPEEVQSYTDRSLDPVQAGTGTVT